MHIVGLKQDNEFILAKKKEKGEDKKANNTLILFKNNNLNTLSEIIEKE